MSDQWLGVFAVIVLVGFVAGVIYIQIRRAQMLLKGWAEENGYEILYAGQRIFRKGPYIWSGRGQVIYRPGARSRRRRATGPGALWDLVGRRVCRQGLSRWDNV